MITTSLDKLIGNDSSARIIDAYVELLDLQKLNSCFKELRINWWKADYYRWNKNKDTKHPQKDTGCQRDWIQGSCNVHKWHKPKGYCRYNRGCLRLWDFPWDNLGNHRSCTTPVSSQCKAKEFKISDCKQPMILSILL